MGEGMPTWFGLGPLGGACRTVLVSGGLYRQCHNHSRGKPSSSCGVECGGSCVALGASDSQVAGRSNGLGRVSSSGDTGREACTDTARCLQLRLAALWCSSQTQRAGMSIHPCHQEPELKALQ